MKTIDTRVATYDPEIVGSGYSDDAYDTAVMVVSQDGTGCWVGIGEHENVVQALQDRITYLENICEEQTRMLTGD